MATRIQVQPLTNINPDPDTAKAHHIGSPPTAFTNPWPSFRNHSRLEVLKLRFGSSPDKNFVPVPEGPDNTRSTELVQVLKPEWNRSSTFPPDHLRATWIGHASFLVETPLATPSNPPPPRGIRILFDPVFSPRTSPVSWAGPKRYTPPPCALADLPDIDILCISHNHYDHLDIHTVLPIYQRHRENLHIFVPLGMKAWFVSHVHCSPESVTEMDWWDSTSVTIAGLGSVTLTCTPAQHFSARTLFDAGHVLWCSWAVTNAAGKSFFFAGDTGYQALDSHTPCPAFAQIGQHLGPFDLAMLPIGLYSPPRLSSSVHVTPEQALLIHKEIRSKLSVGMHYGTVRGGLSVMFEDVRDPPRRWREVAEKEGVWAGGGVEGGGQAVDVGKGGVGLCHVGETVCV